MPWPRRELVHSNGAQIPIVVGMDMDIALIHQGKGFTNSDRHTALASAGVLNHLIVTGNLPVHIRVLQIIANETPIDLAYFEDTVVSANGTEEPVGNNNRVIGAAPQFKIYTGPTITSDGTQIGTGLIPASGGGGVGNGQGGLAILAGGEWVLKPNSNYLFRITNSAAAATDIDITIFANEVES